VILTAVVLATVHGRTDLCADIGALCGNVVEVEVGVLSSSEGRKGGDESELGEKHVDWIRNDLLIVEEGA
jgi:hypothetical protein